MEITSASFLYFVSTIIVGFLSPIETYTSVHAGTDLLDTKQPMISAGVQQNIYDNIDVFFEHQSSPMTLEDGGLDHIGLKYKFDNNFYAGSSIQINPCDNCSQSLIIAGYEKQKLFIEYTNKRIYSGLKFLF